jgi:hypothetical protein
MANIGGIIGKHEGGKIGSENLLPNNRLNDIFHKIWLCIVNWGALIRIDKGHIFCNVCTWISNVDIYKTKSGSERFVLK